jgi:hypothetical protein
MQAICEAVAQPLTAKTIPPSRTLTSEKLSKHGRCTGRSPPGDLVSTWYSYEYS